MTQLIIQLFGIFGPIVTQMVQRYMADHDGAMPTDAELIAEFEKNIDDILSEADAWRVLHPVVPDPDPTLPL